MLPLITANDIRAVRDLSNQIKDSKINPIISDAEISDLRPLLGHAFFYDIKKTPANYTDLLNGSEYIVNETTFYQFGVKRLLCELAYVRYMFDSSDISTPFGVVNKDFENGTKISREREKELSNLRKKTTNDFWIDIKYYLENNKDLYALYKGSFDTIKTFQFKNITRHDGFIRY